MAASTVAELESLPAAARELVVDSYHRTTFRLQQAAKSA